MKKLICVLFALTVLLSATAFAESGVTFLGPDKDNGEGFSFKPGSVYQATDLFENFKGVMPGDKLEQIIPITNASKAKVRIYLRAEEEITQSVAGFLEQLTLSVETPNEDVFTPESAAAPLEAGEEIPLGVFKQKGEATLTVTLNVPITLDSTYMNAMGTIPWTFIAEEVPEEGSPETGDWFQIGIWAAAAAALAAGIVVILILKRRQREEN